MWIRWELDGGITMAALGEGQVRRFIDKVAKSHGNPFFDEMHDAIRDAFELFAKSKGFLFTAEELEEVLWEYGLGHEQLELHSKSPEEAETRIKKRLEEEEEKGKNRSAAEKKRITEKVRLNVREWRKGPGKKVDEHTAIMLTHSSTIG